MDKPNAVPVTEKRDALMSRIKNKYADKEFNDDEAYFGQINDDYDAYEKQVGDLTAANEDYKKREKSFADLFQNDPRSARYLKNWRDGEDPAIALVREFGDDIKDFIDDPDKQEAVAAANKEFAARIAQEKELEGQYNDNLKESLTMIDGLKAEGMDDDTIDATMAEYIKLATDALMGKFTREGFDMLCKAKNYEADVNNAAEEGKIAGRNEKIEEKLESGKKGDGLAPLGGETGKQADKMPAPSNGAIDRFSSNQSIWERGNEKRRRF